MNVDTPVTAASINGVVLNATAEILSAAELRQRACSELLRQAAMAEGLLPASDAPATDGALGEAASLAIEALLERRLVVPEPAEDECRRHHGARRTRYSTGERVYVRHILFAVTPGVDVAALRNRAETSLLDLRCDDDCQSGDRFAQAAATLSNCPSGAQGGDLGWLGTADCAPEFAREIFGHAEVGVLPSLVHSRFGFHVVEVLQRKPGVEQSYAAVRGVVAMALQRKAYINALRHYLGQLADQATVVGVDIGASDPYAASDLP